MLCHLPLLFPVAGLVLFAFLPFPVALAVYLPLAGLGTFAGLKVIEAMRRPASTGAHRPRPAGLSVSKEIMRTALPAAVKVMEERR